MATINVTIAAGIDDVKMNVGFLGPSAYTTGDANVRVGFSTFMAGFNEHVGLRFPSVNVAQGIVATAATITVQVVSVSGTPDFTIRGNDVDDAPAWPASITESSSDTAATITSASPGVVTDTAHGLSNGNVVNFSNLSEMTELNGVSKTIANVTTDTFEIDDTSGFAAETTGGKWSLDGNRPGAMGDETTASVSPTVAGTGQISFNVLGIVNEIFQRGSWAANNDMRFQLKNNATATNNFSMESQEVGSPIFGPAQLDITFPEDYIMPVFPIESVDYDGAPKVFPSRHVGDGSNYPIEEGFCGVMAALDADSAVFLRFMRLPNTLPGGSPYISLFALADDVALGVTLQLFWAAVAAEEDPSSATLNDEGEQTLTWSPGDDDVYKSLEWQLDVTTVPAAGDIVVAKLLFKSTSDLAVVSTWKGWLQYK